MNRHDRRRANKMGRPVVVTSEIFEMVFSDGMSLNLDVVRMRAWAETNCDLRKIPIDAEYLEKLRVDGTVTEERVMGHSIHQIPKHILVCETPNGAQIVDGNHAYVAAAFHWKAAYEHGLVPKSQAPSVPGYVLTETQWRRFVIPSSQIVGR